MSIYSNVIEQDLISSHELAEQQKKERALHIKDRILKQTHGIKLAEIHSPTTKKLDEVNESTQKIREIVRGTQPETPQLAIENTSTHQPIENNERVIYDVEPENTLKNMREHWFF